MLILKLNVSLEKLDKIGEWIIVTRIGLFDNKKAFILINAYMFYIMLDNLLSIFSCCARSQDRKWTYEGDAKKSSLTISQQLAKTGGRGLSNDQVCHREKHNFKLLTPMPAVDSIHIHMYKTMNENSLLLGPS